MALWRQFLQKEQFPSETERPKGTPWALRLTSRPQEQAENNESIITPGLTIEGKIEGAGDVRLAGRFKGEVHVKGDLTVEPGAHISGEIRAENVVVKGEVEGNVDATSRLEFLESGVLIGDLKASSLTVAAGSRMRGKVDFGWDEREAEKVIPITAPSLVHD